MSKPKNYLQKCGFSLMNIGVCVLGIGLFADLLSAGTLMGAGTITGIVVGGSIFAVGFVVAATATFIGTASSSSSDPDFSSDYEDLEKKKHNVRNERRFRNKAQLKTTAELIAELNALPAAPTHVPTARKTIAVNPSPTSQPTPKPSVLKRFTHAVGSTFSGFFSGSGKTNTGPRAERYSLRRTL